MSAQRLGKSLQNTGIGFWGLQTLSQSFEVYLHLHCAISPKSHRIFTKINCRRNQAHLFKPTKKPQASKQANKTSFELNQLWKKNSLKK